MGGEGGSDSPPGWAQDQAKLSDAALISFSLKILGELAGGCTCLRISSVKGEMIGSHFRLRTEPFL